VHEESRDRHHRGGTIQDVGAAYAYDFNKYSSHFSHCRIGDVANKHLYSDGRRHQERA
jgi:hypothetical protein